MGAHTHNSNTVNTHVLGVCGDQSLMSGVFLSYLPPYFQGFSPEPLAHQLGYST